MAIPTGALRRASAVALMLFMGWRGTTAQAADSQERQRVIACVDARATYVLTDRQLLARHTARWRANVERRGRCFGIEPGNHWEPIYSLGGLVLMRRTPPEPGVPPLYFRADAAPEVSAPVDRAPGEPAAIPWARPTPKPVTPKPGPMPFRIARPAWRASGEAAAETGAEIRVEDLPPPGSVPAAVSSRAPAPALAAIAPGKVSPVLTRPDATPASTRSYALGFGLAIVLITLLLATMALLLRFLLRWLPQPVRAFGSVRAPIAPLTPPDPDPNADEHRRSPIISTIPAEQRRPVAHRPAPVRIVPAMLQAAGLARGPEPWQPEDRNDIQYRCSLLLREAGWNTRSRPLPGQGQADIVARRHGRVMALRCLAEMSVVDEQAVEEACMVREREKADVAAIISNVPCTPGARRLAAQTGVDLLQESELRAFAC